MMSTHVLEIAVRYAETDASGVVWHGSYLAWLEIGRVELLQARGLPYTEVEAAGYSFPLSELHVRYHAPARFGDVVSVQVSLSELKSRRLEFEYEVRRRGDEQPLVTARTIHLIVSRRGLAVNLPARWRHVLGTPA